MSFMLIIMIKEYIGLIPATFLHITMVDYKFSTQGYLNNLFQRVCEDKILNSHQVCVL